MKNNLYVIYNSLSLRYGDVIAYPTDAYASRQIKTMVERGGLNEAIENIEICRIGSIDIESGVAETYAPVRINLEDTGNIN